MPFKYALMCDTLPWIGYNVLETPREIMQAAADAGYDAIDLPADLTMDAQQWRQMVEESGLVVTEVLAAWGYYHAGEERNLASPNGETRQRAVQYALDTVDLAAALGARFTELCAAQPAVPQLPYPRESIAVLRRNFRDSIQQICAHAGERGITILLEPLNCYEGLPGVLTTLYEAINYVDELGCDNLGIQPDVYHMNIEEGSIPDALRAAGGRIKHFHLNETNHCLHGMGHADYQEIFRILQGIGYDGYLATYMPRTTQEILHSAPGNPFLDAVPSPASGSPRPELREILNQILDFLKETERAVCQSRQFYEADGFRS